MRLLTRAIRKTLPKLGATDNQGMQAIAFVHYFSKSHNLDWYATEFDGVDTFFGLVTGVDLEEYGHFWLEVLESLYLPANLHFIPGEKMVFRYYKVERDLHWTPQTLEAILDEQHRLKKYQRPNANAVSRTTGAVDFSTAP